MGLFKRSRVNIDKVLDQEIEMGDKQEKPELILLIDERIDGLQEILEDNMINVSKIRCSSKKIEQDIMAYMSIVKSEIVIVETGKGNIRNYSSIKVLNSLSGIRDTMVHITVMYSSEEIRDIFRRNKDITLVKYQGLVPMVNMLKRTGYKKPNRVVDDWLKVEREEDINFKSDSYEPRNPSDIRDNEIDFSTDNTDDCIKNYSVKI